MVSKIIIKLPALRYTRLIAFALLLSFLFPPLALAGPCTCSTAVDNTCCPSENYCAETITPCGGDPGCGNCDGQGLCAPAIEGTSAYLYNQHCNYKGITLHRGNTDLFIGVGASLTLTNNSKLYVKSLTVADNAGDAVFIQAGSELFAGASCSDECLPVGETRCFDADSTELCGNHDADPCWEWGGVTDCQDNKCWEPTCTDGVCGETLVAAGGTDEACYDNTGCVEGSGCSCDGNGACLGCVPPCAEPVDWSLIEWGPEYCDIGNGDVYHKKTRTVETCVASVCVEGTEEQIVRTINCHPSEPCDLCLVCGGGVTEITCEVNCAGFCGSVDGIDSCGDPCTKDCGGCTLPETCGGGGTANVCGCTPDCSDAANYCADYIDPVCGATCPGTDVCVAPETCGGGGTANVCGCTPNCDWAANFCDDCTYPNSDGCGGPCTGPIPGPCLFWRTDWTCPDGFACSYQSCQDTTCPGGCGAYPGMPDMNCPFVASCSSEGAACNAQVLIYFLPPGATQIESMNFICTNTCVADPCP